MSSDMEIAVNVDFAAALHAGKQTYGWITASLPAVLTPAQRDAYAGLQRRSINTGRLSLESGDGVAPLPDASPETIARALAERHQWLASQTERKAAEQKAKDAKDIAAILADDPAAFVSRKACRYLYEERYRYETMGVSLFWGRDRLLERPELAGIIARAQQLADTRTETNRQEALTRMQHDEAVKQAKIEATSRRKAQIDAWVAEQGDTNQRGRHALGLLPDKEVVDAIRNAAYASLNHLPRYQRIKFIDLAHEEDCAAQECENMSCDNAAATSLSAESYERFLAVKAAAPDDAWITVRDHTCECQGCDAKITRHSAKVEITVGEFEFSREYALD